MCEFYLNGKCFNSARTQGNLLATTCEVHGCEHCTNKQWQKEQLENELQFFNNLPMQNLNISKIKSNNIETISAIGAVLKTK